jgi:hypothetical protein
LNPKNYRASTKRLVDDLLKSLGMEKLGPLQIYWATDQRAPGWSFIQPITTSHISGHYFEKPGKSPHIHIDIYSCDKVNYRKVLDVLHRHLQFSEWSANFITRDTKHMQRAVQHLSGNGKNVTVEHTLRH